MKWFLRFTLIIPLCLNAQEEERILSYDVRGVVNEQISGMSGNVFVRVITRTTTLDIYSFLIPSGWSVNSIRDGNNESYDTERSPSDKRNFSRIDIELTDERRLNDTLLLNMEFTARFDSSSFSDQFITPNELLLAFSDSVSWLPLFGPVTAERVSLEITTAPSMVLFSDIRFDTMATEGSRVWRFDVDHSIKLSRAFTMCGLRSPAYQRSFSIDSTRSISLYSSPVFFNQHYASSITHQLNDAADFFSALTGKKNFPSIIYAIVGGPAYESGVFHGNNFIIHRNSPAFSIFDSSALNQAQFNHWLFETAQRFCPATNDSTAVFDDGFAAYLCSRYLDTRYPLLTQNERIRSIANALTFFPSGTIAAGHRSALNMNDIISYKGRYIFLMLEYVLGRESFDSVIIRLSSRFASEPVTFQEFQTMCEEEYGSSLSWFFAQWLHRSSAPEFVLQWKHDKTVRGMSVVTVAIEQRGELFTMPIPIIFSFGSRTITKRIMVEQAKQEFQFTFPSPPASVTMDPDLTILRWLLEIRISAHARTSLQFLSVSRDIVNAEREAHYTLQLDPNNSTGSTPLVYFVLGNSAAARNDLENAKEYFFKAMSASASAELEKYKLLSLVQYANVLEAEGNREEAVTTYRRAITEGMKNPLLYERAIIKAELHLRNSFESRTSAWFELH